MSAFVHGAAHIDVCVDAAKYADNVTDPETWYSLAETDSTELGKRMIRANIDSVIARYGLAHEAGGSIEKAEQAAYERLHRTYQHRTNTAVIELWQPRRLATYMRALDSLAYQSCEVAAWVESPMAKLLADVRDDLGWRMGDLLASGEVWAWTEADRGALPRAVDGRRRGGSWAPPVEVVKTADDDGWVQVRVFVDGEEVTPCVHSVDAGAGWSWADWVAHREATLAAASAAARAVLVEAFTDPRRWEHVTGRGDAG